jgi:CO dehydrogenase maturation factor
VDGTRRDWARYTAQAVQFHLRNAKAWANDRTGEDLAGQIDPEFDISQWFGSSSWKEVACR